MTRDCGWRRTMRKPDAPAPEKPAPPPAAPTPEPPAEAPTDNLDAYTVADLKDYAKDIGLTGVSTLNKSDLIAAIRAHEG